MLLSDNITRELPPLNPHDDDFESHSLALPGRFHVPNKMYSNECNFLQSTKQRFVDVMAVMRGAACTQSKYTDNAFIARSHYYYSLRTFVSAAEWFEAGQRGEGIKEDAHEYACIMNTPHITKHWRVLIC